MDILINFKKEYLAHLYLRKNDKKRISEITKGSRRELSVETLCSFLYVDAKDMQFITRYIGKENLRLEVMGCMQ